MVEKSNQQKNFLNLNHPQGESLSFTASFHRYDDKKEAKPRISTVAFYEKRKKIDSSKLIVQTTLIFTSTTRRMAAQSIVN